MKLDTLMSHSQEHENRLIDRRQKSRDAFWGKKGIRDRLATGSLMLSNITVLQT